MFYHIVQIRRGSADCSFMMNISGHSFTVEYNINMGYSSDVKMLEWIHTRNVIDPVCKCILTLLNLDKSVGCLPLSEVSKSHK